MNNKKTLTLIILDGFGHIDSKQNNAIYQAHTPTWDKIWENNPKTLISGSGLDVGLPDGQMGNSEVGHMTIGSGRVIYQDLTKINKAIQDKEFQLNPAFNQAIDDVISSNKTLHIMGLFSPGGVHSHEEHFFEILKLAKNKNLSKIFFHLFLDGRDTPPKSAKNSIIKLQNLITKLNIGEIASITGRFYAMDRDNRYERTQLAYEMLTENKAKYNFTDPILALEAGYARDETDEFILPTITTNQDISVKDGDSIIFMNFRSDRARQLSHAFITKNFDGFKRNTIPKIKNYVSMTEYASNLKTKIAFPKPALKNVLGEYLQNNNLTQLRIAETEKYAHVTFFFNGGVETQFKGEDRILIPSPKVTTYDLQPEMSAYELTDALIKKIASCEFDVIICNYANPDMVGHTGNIEASIKAIETIDKCLAKIIQVSNDNNGQIIITADHGNIEVMYDEINQQPHTAHTTSLVPFVYIGNKEIKLRSNGGLQDVAPTILDIINLPTPVEMTGKSLIEND